MSIIQKIFSAITGSAPNPDASHEPLNIGSKLPTVTQINQDGDPIELNPSTAQGHLLVYFYPKADTPGCTKQACSLRDAFSSLSERGLKVIGVSTDNAEKQKAFQQKYQLPFDLLADEDGSVVDAFGVPKTMGYSKRQAFLFKDGTLIWRDLSASTAEQAADILAQLEAA